MLCNPVLLVSLCSIYYSKSVSHLSPAWQASTLFGCFFLAGNLVLPCLTEDQPLLVWTVGSLEKQPYNSKQPQHNIRHTLPGKLTYPRTDCCCILGEYQTYQTGLTLSSTKWLKGHLQIHALLLIFCPQELEIRLKIQCTVNTLCPA